MNVQLLFIALVLLVSPLVWLLPKSWGLKVMSVTTAGVLIYIAPLSISIMLAVAILQWLIWSRGLHKSSSVGLMLTLLLPLLPLFSFKIGAEITNWLIPLGLSYYAFRQIHVAFEIYKEQLATPSLDDYFQYLLFLPVFLVGPIHRMPEFLRSIRRHKWQAAWFAEGLERMLYGMVKIFFFGNYLFTDQLGKLAASVEAPFLKLYITMISFTGNAYMQFAGFSDLAIGMALIWGVRVIENFNHPFLATNMQDFWQRWHISLSSWCRDYVFHPINAWSRNRWLALIMSMLVLALWHELSLRYIVWGGFHACLILLTVRSRKLMPSLANFINENQAGKWLGRIWVFHLFAFSCLFIGALDNTRIDHPLIEIFK